MKTEREDAKIVESSFGRSVGKETITEIMIAN
jgi:hypothetical protein